MYNFTLKIITSLSSGSMIFSDGYAGYSAVCRGNGITQLGCWDHARHKFKEAQKAQPKAKKGKNR